MAAGSDTTSNQCQLENGLCNDTDKGGSGTDKDVADESDDSAKAKMAKPPLMRHCISQATLADTFPFPLESTTGIAAKTSCKDFGYVPVFRSGSCSEIGPKTYMEDEFICVDNLSEHLGTAKDFPSPGAFYGVFDGHGGRDAASFTKKNLLKFIVEDLHFPDGVKRAVRNAFVKVDHALADSKHLDLSSGTTALTALVLERTLLIANAGDSRAVLGKRGRAIELSKDHKPNCTSEKLRIEKLGGVIYDGYLNGQLSVARSLGDWHIKGSKGSKCPLSAEPELEEIVLSEEDEFLIIGCDGLWDVMSSQYAVTIEPPPQIEVPKMHKRRSISAEGLDVLKGILNNV
ncbi:probable protein phosphatase 2C 47 isoform X2 [Andrographis paniculata]|uniref:probable protein phosphatase 2C 47 isoform X2 n=1 Tax=Andrographis paniculata TaxID=175694 RepID=UPI0021E99D62|nr:probable protein phosphatase 2C 47 isoform X2 [Andrographis paniculata]XP_051141425.1 probable protein phosphatase 2C 47 isoform X2 [Andrographis paniculata]